MADTASAGSRHAPVRHWRKAAIAALTLTTARGSPCAASTALGVIIGATAKTSRSATISRANGSLGATMCRATIGATTKSSRHGSRRRPRTKENNRRRNEGGRAALTST